MSKYYSSPQSLDDIVIVAKPSAWAPVGFAATFREVNHYDRLLTLQEWNEPPTVCTVANGELLPPTAFPKLFNLLQYSLGTGKGNAFQLPLLSNVDEAKEYNRHFSLRQTLVEKDGILLPAYKKVPKEKRNDWFSDESDDISGSVEYVKNKKKRTKIHLPDEEETWEFREDEDDVEAKDITELLDNLHGMIGLSPAKKHVDKLVAFEQICKRREAAGMIVPQVSHHLALLGPPGTGKSTLGRIIAEFYYSLNVLPSNRFIETDRAGLVGKYIGDTAQKTMKMLRRAHGGVLFVDEAYALAGSDKDFGAEALAIMLKYMEDHRNEIVIILAGYPEKMEELWRTNPGLQSRIPVRNRILFDAYSEEELLLIAQKIAREQGYRLAKQTADKIITLAAQERTVERFGNGRWARDLVESGMFNHALRLRDIEGELDLLQPDDLEYNEDTHAPRFGFH